MDRPGCPSCGSVSWKVSYAHGRRAGFCSACDAVFEVCCCDACDDCVPFDATVAAGERRLCEPCFSDAGGEQ